MHDLFVLLMRKENRFLSFNYFLQILDLSSHCSRKDYNCKKSCVLVLHLDISIGNYSKGIIHVLLLQRKRNKDSEKKLHEFDFTNVLV